MTQVQLIPLVSIKQHNIALLFTNYIETIGIIAKIEKDEDDFAVLVDESQFDRAKSEFETFIQSPFAEKYQQAAWQHGEISEVSNSHPPLLTSFKERFFNHAGIITLVVFSLCWLVFIASILGFANPVFNAIKFFPTLSIEHLLSEPYRLIGPALFHFSWLHIVFNTMWWWQLGGDVERQLGKGSLINLFLVSAIISNLGQYMVTGSNFGGLSGVVYGLVGYVWWMHWLRPQAGLVISKPIVGILLVWMLLGFANLLPVNMANAAHLLGLLSGCGLALLKSRSVPK